MADPVMRASDIKKVLKKTFPSLGWRSIIVFLDPEYEIPDHNKFVAEYKAVWDDGLTELRRKAIELEWLGVQCEDFVNMALGELEKRRLQKENKPYLPSLKGRMVGQHMVFKKWYGHSWGYVITTNGLYLLNYEVITKNYKRFKPNMVVS